MCVSSSSSSFFPYPFHNARGTVSIDWYWKMESQNWATDSKETGRNSVTKWPTQLSEFFYLFIYFLKSNKCPLLRIIWDIELKGVIEILVGGGEGETILSVELIKEWRIIFTANLLHQTESQRRSRTFMPSGNLSRTSLLSYRPNTGASLY